MARFQAGEPEALGALFEIHVDRVYSFAYHMLHSREDAEEVTSEAFLRAFERAETFRGESAFRGWLFGITRHLCLDRLRQPRLIGLEPEEGTQEYNGSTSDRIETDIIVKQALETLPEEYQLVLKLCDVEEWDAREAACVLERSVPATKSLLYRARRAMRASLKSLWSDDADEETRSGM